MTSQSDEGVRYHLRNTNAQEVEISHTRELEEQLFGHEIPYGIPGRPDSVGHIVQTAARINERLLELDIKGNMAAIGRGLDVLSTKNDFDNGLLIDRRGGILEAASNRCWGLRVVSARG